MKHFLLALVIVVLIPVIWMMGIQGLTFDEMLLRLGIKRERKEE